VILSSDSGTATHMQHNDQATMHGALAGLRSISLTETPRSSQLIDLALYTFYVKILAI
jgi:hypothetical protein